MSHALRQKEDSIPFNLSFEGLGKDAFESELGFARKFTRLLARYAHRAALLGFQSFMKREYNRKDRVFWKDMDD
jgi:hypothetical protein